MQACVDTIKDSSYRLAGVCLVRFTLQSRLSGLMLQAIVDEALQKTQKAGHEVGTVLVYGQQVCRKARDSEHGQRPRCLVG